MCRWRVEPALDSLPALRADISEISRRWALSTGETQDAVLVVNELVTNAIDHAHSACRVTLRLNRSMIRILVSDLSPVGPIARPRDTQAVSGRGMHIVAGLTRQWGWHRHHRGKTVWASMDRAPIGS